MVPIEPMRDDRKTMAPRALATLCANASVRRNGPSTLVRMTRSKSSVGMSVRPSLRGPYTPALQIITSIDSSVSFLPALPIGRRGIAGVECQCARPRAAVHRLGRTVAAGGDDIAAVRCVLFSEFEAQTPIGADDENCFAMIEEA